MIFCKISAKLVSKKTINEDVDKTYRPTNYYFHKNKSKHNYLAITNILLDVSSNNVGT